MHHPGWTRLRRVLLMFVPLFSLLAVAVVVRHRPQDAEARALRFEVARADKQISARFGEEARFQSPAGQLMTLDTTGKYLLNSVTNQPVFVTGDDAWSLEVQLSDEDIRSYLDDRASRGFNAIWVGLVDNTYSNHPPKDFYGNAPFNGPDFTSENPAYWRRVDQTLREAAARRIVVFASPAFVGAGCSGGYCQSYRSSSVEVVAAYGEFLGKRYRDFPNIVWLIGGDADPSDKNVQAKLYVLALGIRSGDPVHLITTENLRGTSSIDIWSEAKWLDLDGLYLEPQDIARKAKTDYVTGTHPVFLFEDWYEGEHGISEFEVREEGYRAVLSGCTLGRFFGNYAIWNFSWHNSTTDPWKSQLGSEGSLGQAWLGRLFRSREHWNLVPDLDNAIITNESAFWEHPRAALELFRQAAVGPSSYRAEKTLPIASRTVDGQTIIVYVPHGRAAPVVVAMNQIKDPGPKAKGWWFNPRDGSTALIGIFATDGARGFSPPDANDWVLVIDSLAADLPPPGGGSLS